jgi:hypothetical protein
MATMRASVFESVLIFVVPVGCSEFPSEPKWVSSMNSLDSRTRIQKMFVSRNTADGFVLPRIQALRLQSLAKPGRFYQPDKSSSRPLFCGRLRRQSSRK